MKGKAVIVTGGGGSIGSEICDRVATFGAARLLVIENSEPALYAVMEALAARDTSAVIEGRIADIRDRDAHPAADGASSSRISCSMPRRSSTCRSSSATGAKASRPTFSAR